MANITKFLQPLTFRASSFTSIIPHPTSPFYGKFLPLKTWIKDIQLRQLQYRNPCFQWKLYPQQVLRSSNFCISGHRCTTGIIFGMSVVVGSASFYPQSAYCMDGDDHQMDLLDSSDPEEDQLTFLNFTRKLLVPFFLISTIWMNWGHPVILVSKAVLILFTTKPSPLSVYVFVDQLRRRSLQQYPLLYKYKSLYAKKVEVEDYTLLCVAKVEIEKQRLTLIGILGNWWVLQSTSSEGEISAFKKRALSYVRNSVS